MLKNKLKELEVKYKNLEDMVKDLIKNVKYEPIIKPYIVQICQIFGYSPQTTQKIVKNKISGLKNFVLKWRLKLMIYDIIYDYMMIYLIAFNYVTNN